MIKTAAVAIGTTAKDFFKNWGAMAVYNPLYALLLVSLYLFLLTKESSVLQLTATSLLAVAALILFYLLQSAAAVRYAHNESRPFSLFVQSLNAMWKLLLVSIPVILVAVLAVYLINKLQAHFPLPAPAEPIRSGLVPMQRAAQKPVLPFSWTSALLFSLRLIVLGVALPLVAIHFWLGTARDGLWATFKRTPRIIGLAFSAESILVYGIGSLFFGLLPYFLVFTRTPVKSSWAELCIFGIRLAFTFILTLWGWIITVGVLATITGLQEVAKSETESGSARELSTSEAIPG